MSRYDVIIIGAGVNGLTAATCLARAGRHVLVLEARSQCGGLAAAEEFHPGFRSAGFFQDTTLVQRELVDALGLAAQGLRWRERPPDVLALGHPGDALLLSGDPTETAHRLERRSQRDAEQLLRFTAFMEPLRPLVKSWMHEPPLDPTDDASLRLWEILRRGLRLRRLGRRGLLDLLRLPPLSLADGLHEWFEDALLQTALAIPALASTWMGPRSPGGYALLLRQLAAAGPGIVGNGPALVEALERSARAFGAEIRLGALVETLHVNGRVQAVSLADGERIETAAVAASCHPRSVFLSLLPAQVVPARLARQIESIRSRGTTAQVLLALRSPLVFKGFQDQPIEFARIGASLDDLERAFDAVKYGDIPSHPALEVHCRAGASEKGVAATGPVASILVHFAPYALSRPWDEEARHLLTERVLALLTEHVERLDVVKSMVLAPPDLEARFHLPGGHVHHGEHALDQLLLRPAPGCVAHATPIPGLFLCGSGSHPGGGLTCAPGALGARAILSA